MADQANATAYHIRWMIRRDMPKVLDIERESFEYPWAEDDFISVLRHRKCIGMVAGSERDADSVLGYIIYELYKTRIHLMNIAVATPYRRNGIGRLMVAKIIGKLSAWRRTRLTIEVRETNLPAQQFFRAMGFKAISVERAFYNESDTTEDAYFMQYRIPTQDKEAICEMW